MIYGCLNSYESRMPSETGCHKLPDVEGQKFSERVCVYQGDLTNVDTKCNCNDDKWNDGRNGAASGVGNIIGLILVHVGLVWVL